MTTEPEPCEHLPALSEPSLTLHCTKCAAWLKALDDGTYEEVPRGEATRGAADAERRKLYEEYREMDPGSPMALSGGYADDATLIAEEPLDVVTLDVTDMPPRVFSRGVLPLPAGYANQFPPGAQVVGRWNYVETASPRLRHRDILTVADDGGRVLRTREVQEYRWEKVDGKLKLDWVSTP